MRRVAPRSPRNTKSLGVVAPPEEERQPESGVRRSTLRAIPPPPAPRRTTTMPQVYSADDPGETALNEIVRELARLSDPLSVPVLARPIEPDDCLGPQEAYIASLVGESMTVQSIVDVSPLEEDETVRFLARLVTKRLVTIAGVKKP